MKRAYVLAIALLLSACGAPSPAAQVQPTSVLTQAPTQVAPTKPADTPAPKPTDTAKPPTATTAPTVAPTVKPTDTAKPPPASPTSATLPRLGQPAEKSGYSLTATTVEDPAKPAQFYTAKPDKRLVAVEIIVGNVSGKALTVNPLDAVLIDAEGFTYRAELGGHAEQISVIQLNPGEKAKGWVAYAIPPAAKLKSIKYQPGAFTDIVMQVGLEK